MNHVAPALRVSRLSKHFGGLVAVNDVSLEVYPGEVVGLLGDNGAGKSTLMKIVTGFLKPTSGQLYIDGAPVTLSSVAHARSLGIEAVYQDRLDQ